MQLSYKLIVILLAALFLSMCVPPPASEDDGGISLAKLDSLRERKCPRLMSSAAEYYRNRDWSSTARIYSEIIELGCDEWDTDYASEIYLYYAVAYENLGKYDSSEVVLLKGLQSLPDDIGLRKRLAYAYKKQNKVNMQIGEYEKLMDMVPNDIEIMSELAKLYGDNSRYDDQIFVLRKLLEKDPENEIAQSEIVVAFKNSGKDPLSFMKERFELNPDNTSYGIEYADNLIDSDRTDEAVKVLERVVRVDNTSKIALKKLADAHYQNNDLNSASKSFEELFKLDPRDIRTAIKISNINVELSDFEKAMKWADKSVQISKSSGESLGQKGDVYYKTFQYCRTGDISQDDRIIATLAYNYFQDAESNGYNRYSKSKNWLKDNEVLFTKANWFMLDPEVKSRGFIKPETECYNWVTEKLNKKSNW